MTKVDDDNRRTRRALEALGVDILEPQTRKELGMAQALQAFSQFVLHDDDKKDSCRAIVEKHLGRSVGELQGGSDDQHEIIYRLSMAMSNEDDYENDDYHNDDTAVAELLSSFYTRHRRYEHILTIPRLQQYMLGMMCGSNNKKKRMRHNYQRLGNLMFILSFGPCQQGQVRHIDHCGSNAQVFLYCSERCPSTTVYAMAGPQITNCHELLEYWMRMRPYPHSEVKVVPDLIQCVLREKGQAKLKDLFYTKRFAFWDNMDAMLSHFGKLYQPVSSSLALAQTEPGTILLARGNPVHAGPPTVEPRMLAFAIGIPKAAGNDDGSSSSSSSPHDESDTGENDNDEDDDDNNNGELQYSRTLLHLDLCCVLFGMIEFEYMERPRHHEHYVEAKQFLLSLLVDFIQEHPTEPFGRVLMGAGDNDNCREVCEWLEQVVESLDDPEKLNVLLREAVESETMFVACSKKSKRRQRTKRKKNRPRASRQRSSQSTL